MTSKRTKAVKCEKDITCNRNDNAAAVGDDILSYQMFQNGFGFPYSFPQLFYSLDNYFTAINYKRLKKKMYSVTNEAMKDYRGTKSWPGFKRIFDGTPCTRKGGRGKDELTSL